MAMEYNLNSVAQINKVFEGSCEQTVDCEINLPDYCDDILRVLKCTVTPCIVSSKISGDRACADGNAVIRIVYCDEEGNICSSEQVIPFSKYVETGAENEGSLFVTAKSEYVNCRAVSRRKAEVHGTIRFVFKIMKATEHNFVDIIETNGVQTKKGCVEFCSVTTCECKQFPLSETAELPSDYLPAQRIINTNAVPVLNEAKIIKGKLLLKGEITAQIIYCSEKNAGECTRYEYSIPLNQVVDASGISEDAFADVKLKISSCEISSREDSEGEQRFFDINLVVTAEITAYVKKQTDFITDAYSTNGEMKSLYEETLFCKQESSINDAFINTCSFDFTAVSAQKLNAVWMGEPEIIQNESWNKTVKGKVPAYFILCDHEEKTIFCERDFEFEYSVKTGQLLSEPSIVVSGYSPSAPVDGKIELKAELIISANTFSIQKEKILVSADIDSEKGLGDNSGIVIYFPDENDKLWDIARKYGTTEQAIMKENDISDDSSFYGKPLIVPCS